MSIDYDPPSFLKDYSSSYRERIERGLNLGIQRASALPELDKIAIIVEPAYGPEPPPWGVTGYSGSKNQISIPVDPTHPQLLDPGLEERLSAIYAEEAHHCVRQRYMEFGDTPGKCLVTEGFAKVFVEETGHARCFTIAGESGSRFNQSELEKIAESVKPILDEKYDVGITLHKALFGGSQLERFPLYAGYALGRAIAAGWLDATKITAAQAVSIKPEIVIQSWLQKGFEPDFDGKKPARSSLQTDRPTRNPAP